MLYKEQKFFQTPVETEQYLAPSLLHATRYIPRQIRTKKLTRFFRLRTLLRAAPRHLPE
jgi:hypothetical protein